MQLTPWPTFVMSAAACLAVAGCKFPFPADVDPDAGGLGLDAPLDGPRGPTFARVYGSTGADFGEVVAASDDAIVLAGMGSEGVNLGGGSLAPFFLAVLDASGQHQGSMALPSAIHDVAFDRFGNFYVVGELDGTANFAPLGGATLVSDGMDLMVAKFDRTGRHVWSRAYGGSGSQVGQRVAVTSSDDVAVCGEYAGSTNLGGQALGERGRWDVFVALLSRTNGDHRWSVGLTSTGMRTSARAIGGNGSAVVANASPGPMGDFVMVGAFSGELPLGSNALRSEAATDGFATRVTTSGAFAWATAVSAPVSRT